MKLSEKKGYSLGMRLAVWSYLHAILCSHQLIVKFPRDYWPTEESEVQAQQGVLLPLVATWQHRKLPWRCVKLWTSSKAKLRTDYMSSATYLIVESINLITDKSDESWTVSSKFLRWHFLLLCSSSRHLVELGTSVHKKKVEAFFCCFLSEALERKSCVKYQTSLMRAFW